MIKRRKMYEKYPYLKVISLYQSELAWLLENIGHPDPAIRDELVYASFATSF